MPTVAAAHGEAAVAVGFSNEDSGWRTVADAVGVT